ncbi:10733_t:CDS:1, partial [Funneliformis geosporum]
LLAIKSKLAKIKKKGYADLVAGKDFEVANVLIERDNESNSSQLYSLIEESENLSKKLKVKWYALSFALWNREKPEVENIENKLNLFLTELKKEIIKFEIERIKSRKKFAIFTRVGESEESSIKYEELPIFSDLTIPGKKQEEENQKNKTPLAERKLSLQKIYW